MARVLAPRSELTKRCQRLAPDGHQARQMTVPATLPREPRRETGAVRQEVPRRGRDRAPETESMGHQRNLARPLWWLVDRMARRTTAWLADLHAALARLPAQAQELPPTAIPDPGRRRAPTRQRVRARAPRACLPEVHQPEVHQPRVHQPEVHQPRETIRPFHSATVRQRLSRVWHSARRPGSLPLPSSGTPQRGHRRERRRRGYRRCRRDRRAPDSTRRRSDYRVPCRNLMVSTAPRGCAGPLRAQELMRG